MITRTIKKNPDVYPIENIRVIDGDAIECTILLPFAQMLRTRVRLKGWWADEMQGAHGWEGLQARTRLENWIKGKALWLRCQSERRDRYGRVIAHLMWHEQIVDPKEVLGPYQLTEEVHRQRLDASRKRPALPPTEWP